MTATWLQDLAAGARAVWVPAPIFESSACRAGLRGSAEQQHGTEQAAGHRADEDADLGYYKSPEQIRRGELGPAADVWGIGAVLFEASVCSSR